MNRLASRSVVALFLCAGLARADVKIQEKTKFKMEGVVGGVVGMFGGKAAKEGLTRTVALRGDRRLSLDENSGELVALDEEKVYRLDVQKKRYEVTTFDELRKQMKKDVEEIREQRQESAKPSTESDTEVDVDVKKTGQKKTINGFECEQAIVTVTARKKGQTLEGGGGTVLTQDMWLAPGVNGQDEMAAFERRYFEKLYGPQQVALADMAAVAATVPGMSEGLEKLKGEADKIQGYPVLTTLTVESVKGAAESAKQHDEDSAPPTSLGGLFGSVAKKVVQTKAESSPRSTVLTSTHELLSMSRRVADADVALPAGYQRK